MALEGQDLGDFRILHEIGRGGMGVVYLAEQISLNRRVALKVLPHTGTVSTDMLARFRREAEAASRLDHPRICAVFATGVYDGIPYIAMRYVEGKSLSRILADRRHTRDEDGKANDTFRFDFDASESATAPPAMDDMDPDEHRRGEDTGSATLADLRWALVLVEKVARALHAAHELRIVHRDIKPGNIMVSNDDEPVILDFGLARSMEGADGHSLTQSGDLMGTPHYMSPEQLSHGRVDARTDVYSLGVTLFELIAGRRPFEAPNREGLYRTILTDEPPWVTQFNPLAERDLELVLATALEKDLNRRYQTALAFAEDLAAVLRHDPIAARPLGPVLRMRKWVRRNPGIATAGFSVILVLVLLLVEAQLYTRWLEEEKGRALELKDEADVARQEATRAADEARQAAERNAALVREKETALRHSRALRLAAESTARAAEEPALALALALQASLLEATPETDRALRLALAATPEESLFPAPRYDDLTQETTAFHGRDRRRLQPTVQATTTPAATPSRRTSDRLRAHMPPTGDVNWKADRIVTLAGEDGGVPVVWCVSDRRMVAVLAGHGQQVHTARFSPDGARVVTAGGDGSVRVFDAETGQQLQALRPPGRVLLDRPSIDEALFDARGSSVIAVAGNLVCQWVYDPLTKEFGAPVQQRYRVIRGAPLVLPHPRFPYVASAATDRVLVWTPYTPSGAGAPRSVEIPGAREAVTALAWAPWDGGGGGGRLALGDASGRVALFDIPPRGHEPASPLWEDAVLMAHEGAVTRLAFSPDGRWLASGSENCEVGVWAVDDRLPRWRPRSGRGRITDLSWSSDGTQLATAAADNRAVILDAATGSERRVFAGHPDWVVRVRFEDEDRRLVTFSFDGSARVYPVASQDASATVTLPDEVTSVEWAPQNDRLLVASRDGSVRLLSADGGDGSSSTMLDQQGLQGARFLPDGKRILLISGNRPWLRLVQANGDTVFSLPLPEGGALVTGSPREMIASTPSGSRILAIGPGGRPTLLTDGGTVLRALDYLIDPLYLMVVSRPGHEEFLAWSGRLPALLLDAEGEIRHTLRMPPEFRGIPAGATFSRDGRFVALTDSSMGVAVYDLLRPTAVSELPWLFHSPTPLACPPAWLQRENGLVLAPKHGPVQILDLGGSGASRKLDIEGARVSRMCSGRSGRPELILLMAQELVVWDLSADRMRMAVPLGSARLGDWDLAPDGERVALGFADGTLRIVDLDTLVQALQCRARPPLAAEMERYEFGTEAEKDLARRREDALTRRIGLDALRGRAISDPTDGHRLAYARRILDARDPAPERFEEAVLLCRRALALKTDPDPAFTELLARAERHCGRVDRAIAILRDALDRLAPTDPSRASLEDEFRVATAAGR